MPESGAEASLTSFPVGSRRRSRPIGRCPLLDASDDSAGEPPVLLCSPAGELACSHALRRACGLPCSSSLRLSSSAPALLLRRTPLFRGTRRSLPNVLKLEVDLTTTQKKIQHKLGSTSLAKMNESDVSGLLCVGMHETERSQEPYATECSKMNQDTSAMYTDHSNTGAFLEEYHMSGSQPLEELRFGSTQHFELQSQRMVADSEEESTPSSPDTSSTTNYDMSGMEQNLQHIYNAYDALVDKDGPVMLSPDYIVVDETTQIEPHITFSSDGIKIEYLDLDLDKMITFDWGLSKIISISCKWAQSVGSALITLFAESEEEIGNSGPASVQFSIDDPQWPRKQENIWHLEGRYIEIWKDIPSDDFAAENWSIESSLFFPSQYFSRTEDFEDIIYPQGDPDAVSISKRDAELLLPETFVNDTIIDFYIKHLTTRIGSIEKRRYHFFNSFFFRKLADLDKDQGRAPGGRAAFLRVRKWTRKINIFEKDFVFIPVNFSLHWSLIVVYGAAKLSAKLPCILHMDSLKGTHSGLKDIIQSYLWEEWKERHPESATDNSDKFLNLRFVSLELPQQDNTFDCGLFLLHYVERFLMDAPGNFNPFKIDHFSSFLTDDWFPPAEASHKRSVIQKLIHEVVTGSLQNHPKLACSNEQLDERHQSRNAEGEPAGEFLAQSCSADQAELVSTIHDDAHGAQRSTSSCLNDSETKPLSASGGMVDSERVSMVCLPENDTVYLSSQDEKNESLVTELNMTSCVPENGEVLKESSCGVSYMEHAESLLLTLDGNQKNSSEAEVKVQDIVVSNHCSASYNSVEVITYQEYSLQRNTDEVGHECYRPSQDMDSLVMRDSSKDDIELNPERMTGETDGSDLGEIMGSVSQSDIDKDVAEVKCEDSPADPITVENDFKDSVKQIDRTADNIHHSEQYISSELTEGNADHGMAGDISQLIVGNTNKLVTCDNAVSSGLDEGNTNQILGGPSTCGTNIYVDAEEAYKHLSTSGAVLCKDAADGAVPCEDDTTGIETEDGAVSHEGGTSCTDAEMTLLDSSMKNKTIPENAGIVQVPHPDSLCEEKAVTGDEFIRKDDAHGTDAKRDDEEAYKHLATSGAVPCKDATDGAVPCEDDTTQDGTVPHEGGTSCTDAEMTLLDSSMKNKNVPENTTSEDNVQVPHPDSLCEEKAVMGDECNRKDDAHGTDAKRDAETTSGAVPCKDATDGAVPCEHDTTDTQTRDGTVPHGGTSCTDAEMTLLDSSMKNKTIPDNTTSEGNVQVPHPDSLCVEKAISGDGCIRKDDAHGSDAKRPLPDGMGEKDTAIAERCIQKDNLHGTDAKKERHYKRRKVLAAESQKERSSSGL
ncbi:hypothetical protein EJB05_03428, partial [Eragrostis curvula]